MDKPSTVTQPDGEHKIVRGLREAIEHAKKQPSLPSELLDAMLEYQQYEARDVEFLFQLLNIRPTQNQMVLAASFRKQLFGVGAQVGWEACANTAPDLAAEITRLRALVEEMKTALTPFAEAASFFDQRYLDTCPIAEYERPGSSGVRIEVGALRRAAALNRATEAGVQSQETSCRTLPVEQSGRQRGKQGSRADDRTPPTGSAPKDSLALNDQAKGGEG